MSLHVHYWDSAGGFGCGACGEWRPDAYICPEPECRFRVVNATSEAIESHWQQAHEGRPVQKGLSSRANIDER